MRELRVEDALMYLDQVKMEFGDRPQIYKEFLDIMKTFKSQQIDTPGVIKRVSSLFDGNRRLVLGFNTFLPEGYKIEIPIDNHGRPMAAVFRTPGQAGFTLINSEQGSNMESVPSASQGGGPPGMPQQQQPPQPNPQQQQQQQQSQMPQQQQPPQPQPPQGAKPQIPHRGGMHGMPMQNQGQPMGGMDKGFSGGGPQRNMGQMHMERNHGSPGNKMMQQQPPETHQRNVPLHQGHKVQQQQHVQKQQQSDQQFQPPYESEEESSEESQAASESEESGSEDDFKIQRVIASKIESRKTWRNMLHGKNTSYIENGSRLLQDAEEDLKLEERFFVKWAGLSFLHSSWESKEDLIDQVEGAKQYLTNGFICDADERMDGEYFDPSFVQVDRILEVVLPERRHRKLNDFGMIFDRDDPDYQTGTGRQFLIKWEKIPYSEATYEFERDLISTDVEYLEHVEGFLNRNRKPSEGAMNKVFASQDDARWCLYKTFGDLVPDGEAKEKVIENYKEDLKGRIFKNGGQLRDYQAEGVSWLLANHINNRSSILADEMGLGKVKLLLAPNVLTFFNIFI